MSFILVFLIISSGTIGTRNLKAQLFLIKIIPSHVQTDHPNQNDTSSFPGHCTCLMNNIITFSRSRNNYSIGTYSIRYLFNIFHRINPFPRIDSQYTFLCGNFNFLFVKINTDYPATVCLQKL